MAVLLTRAVGGIQLARHWETFDTRKEAEASLATSAVALKENRYVPPNDRRTVEDAFQLLARARGAALGLHEASPARR